MELPDLIAGFDWRRMRTAFNNFLSSETPMREIEGVRIPGVRRMSSQFLQAEFEVGPEVAERLLAELIAEGWIEGAKLIPTHKFMGLVQQVERPKLARADALAILEQVLEWVDQINLQVDARVKFKQIDLFGSLLRDVDQVGDIDLFVECTTMDLGDDLQPEDSDREEELIEELKGISAYISPSSWLDREMMPGAPKRQIFPRIG